MDRLVFWIALLAAAAATAAVAQYTHVPAPPNYAINPPAGASPLQEQTLRGYRGELRRTERELLREHPSGLTRDQIELRQQLNSLNPGADRASPPP